MQVAQTVHAAGESSCGDLPEGTIAVALSVPSEPALRQLAQRLADHGVPHRIIVENEGPWANPAMASGVAPTRDRARVRRLTSRLPLVR